MLHQFEPFIYASRQFMGVMGDVNKSLAGPFAELFDDPGGFLLIMYVQTV